MGIAKKRKTKKAKPAVPPLSLLDRSIYYSGMLLSGVILFALLFAYFGGFWHFVYQDPSVIAAEQKAGIFWQLPLLLYIFLSGFIVCEQGLSEKKPLFGKKGVRYGPPQWAHVYPLFSKERKIRPTAENRPSQKRLRKIGRRAWLVGFVFTLLLYPLGLFGRYTLQEGCLIREYNCLNTEVGTYTADQTEHLTIRVRSYRNGRSWYRHWNINLVFATKDEEEFSFVFGNFSDSTVWDQLLRIKAHFSPEQIRYEGRENLHKLIADKSIPPEDWDCLYALFDMSEDSLP